MFTPRVTAALEQHEIESQHLVELTLAKLLPVVEGASTTALVLSSLDRWLRRVQAFVWKYKENVLGLDRLNRPLNPPREGTEDSAAFIASVRPIAVYRGEAVVSATLRWLFEDEATREARLSEWERRLEQLDLAIGLNPNIDQRMLTEYLARDWRTFCTNPGFDLAVLEDPQYVLRGLLSTAGVEKRFLQMPAKAWRCFVGHTFTELWYASSAARFYGASAVRVRVWRLVFEAQAEVHFVVEMLVYGAGDGACIKVQRTSTHLWFERDTRMLKDQSDRELAARWANNILAAHLVSGGVLDHSLWSDREESVNR